MSSDKPHFKIDTVRDRDGDRIITTINLMDGPTLRRRMERKVIDLQQEHLDELLNSMGYYKKDAPSIN